MCKSPIKIPNPNYGKKIASYNFSTGHIIHEDTELSNFVDTRRLIEVPCRVCDECIAVRTSNFTQRMQMESLTSYGFNIMLSYDAAHVPCTYITPKGSSIPALVHYADQTHIQNMMKRLRKLDIFSDRDFRYFAVSEFGSKRLRPHWHIIMFVSRKKGDTVSDVEKLTEKLRFHVYDQWTINVGSKRSPKYEHLCQNVQKVMNGKTYSSYYMELIRPYTTIQGKYVPKPLKIEDFDSPQYFAAAYSYISKYVQKESAFDQTLATYFDKLSNSFIVPSSPKKEMSDVQLAFKQLRAVIGSKFLCSKGLGFGFNPETGKKVYFVNLKKKYHIAETTLACREFQTLVRLALRDNQKMTSDLYRLIVDSSGMPQFSTDAYRKCCNSTLGSIFGVAIRVDRQYRRTFHALYPNEILPPPIKEDELSKLLASTFDTDSVLDVSESELLTARILRDSVERSADSKTPAFHLFLPNATHQPMCSYYTRLVIEHHHLRRKYKALGVCNHNQYMDLIEKQKKQPETREKAQLRANILKARNNNSKFTSDRNYDICHEQQRQIMQYLPSTSITSDYSVIMISEDCEDNVYKKYTRYIQYYY
ncbi:replication initiator protein [Sigmofec virus UA08Rod_3978]|uniref:Replication initiator protein n=1 Tax=Sigmofec virus UA08Rod_3978 TaxID=2929392 RepID=A0A976N185_9VIRU|nr:replication initiator protein [Sigmofec virus UA08Rod_3978]